ncbi:ABC transporter permease [Clostridium akagii]|uniref:ABC transporter permease n=1 Tax=Clostridium akagii TaxID=91623 RepID=UPI00047A257E|nr:ABC transporter permease subunit [Clostridium akagii]
MNRLRDNSPVIIILIIFVLIIVGFEFVPLYSVITSSFQDNTGQGFSLAQYSNALKNPFYYQSIKNSILISLESSIVGIIIATIGANSISKFSTRVREKIITMSNMTSNFSGVPLAFAFIIILGNNGVFTLIFKKFGINLASSFNLYSISGLQLVYIYFQIPLGILLMYPAFDAIKEEWKDAASILGASSFQFWKNIGITVLLPSMIGTFNIMFANAMGAYATALALTNGSINLMPLRIGALVSGDIFMNPMQASALAVILGLILTIVNIINVKLIRKERTI